MAASLLSHVVSDLCIGKPRVRVLPPCTPVAAALAGLRTCADPFVFVDVEPFCSKKTTALSVKISVADVLCYACGDTGNLSASAAALGRPMSALAAAIGAHGVTRLVEPQTSIRDAIDTLLTNNSHSLLVPLHGRARREHRSAMAVESDYYCVLTQEDIVRHLFDFISLFSPVAVLTVASLGIIRRDVHAIHADDASLEAIPLLRRSIGDGTAVAIVAEDDALVGEICPSVLDLCGAESASAALATLSAGDVMTCKYCSSSPPEFLLGSIKAQVMDNGLDAAAKTADTSSLLSSPSSSSSTSSGSFPWRSIEYGAICHAGSSLVAVMGQALARRVGYVWVVDDFSGALVGIVSFSDVLAVLRDYLRRLVPTHVKGVC